MPQNLLRFLVLSCVFGVFFRHLQGAVRTFSLVKGERPARKINFFPLAMVAILIAGSRSTLNSWLVLPGLAGFTASLALFEWARATVRGKFFSYAYSNDTPQFLMDQGPYAYIRNPFYTSYLTAYASAIVLFPGWITGAVFVGMFWFLLSAARHEERKFSRSALRLQYEAYKSRTGRFLPRLT
jgi:protein-S-isoprenylcysteine O-methyltransferase Ste14